jgi:membrane-bound serine protease (ClpP class)
MDTNMSAKVENDAAAYIRSIAEKRGRNIEWAESAVKESVALSETEALQENVVDLVVPTVDDLLAALDGRTVKVGEESVTLRTRGEQPVYVEMNWRDRFLATIANPNVAYILFMIGLLGLYFELSTPGAILPGVAGVICLILAFFAFQTLSVNYAGVLLIILAVILFIVDVKAATHGVLTIGGLIAMFIGSVMLFRSAEASLRVSMQLIVAVVLATGLFFALGAWLSVQGHKRRPTTGDASLIGQEGDARTPITPAGGSVFVAGAHWNAASNEEIAEGRRVRVTGVKGMTLDVEEIND